MRKLVLCGKCISMQNNYQNKLIREKIYGLFVHIRYGLLLRKKQKKLILKKRKHPFFSKKMPLDVTLPYNRLQVKENTYA